MDRLLLYRLGNRVPALGKFCTLMNYMVLKIYLPSTAQLGKGVKLCVWSDWVGCSQASIDWRQLYFVGRCGYWGPGVEL